MIDLGIILCGVAFVVGLLGGVTVFHVKELKNLDSAKNRAERILNDAKAERERILREEEIESKAQRLKLQEEFEREIRARREEIKKIEARLENKEEALDRRAEQFERQDEELRRQEQRLSRREEETEEQRRRVEETLEKTQSELNRIAAMTPEEAKELLIQRVERDARLEAAEKIKQIEEKARANGDERAKEIIVTAMQRFAGEVVASSTVSVVGLPTDEMKGRIIGREGRNIRAFEAATGIDLIIDDTPEAVVVSGFNPVRREIAKIALERLISDGRIHPSRIEEVVERVNADMDHRIKELGEAATYELGLSGIHLELIKLLGRLHYRTSGMRNQLQHSIEVGYIAGVLAAELSLNVKQAKRAGLLHDIGKAVEHQAEGPHNIVGADVAHRYGEAPRVVQAIRVHEGGGKPESLLDIAVDVANRISRSRPGARKEFLETFVRRLHDLERMASSFPGVRQAYVVQAGREVRVMVEPEHISDGETVILAQDIAKRVETELSYPGEINIHVLRETRITTSTHRSRA